MTEFVSHVDACDFARSYFPTKWPMYRLKFQTDHRQKDNIRMYLVDVWKHLGHENIPLGWVYNTAGVYRIAIDDSLERYVGASAVLTEVLKYFEESTRLYKDILQDDESKYYSGLLNSVRKDNYNTLPTLPVSAIEKIKPRYGEELDQSLAKTAKAVFVREHGNKYSWGMYMKKLPDNVDIYPVRKRNGLYVLKTKLNKFEKDDITQADDKFSLAGRYQRNPLMFSSEHSLDSSSLSTMARAHREVETERRYNAHFPLDSAHPKFDTLSPTTQKLIILREKKIRGKHIHDHHGHYDKHKKILK